MKQVKYLGSKHLIILVITVMFVGCIPQTQLNYLQTNSETNFKPLDGITDKYFLQPNDYLYIQINTMDPKLSDFFNPQSSNNQASNNQSNQNFYYYIIDDSLCVDFPYAGKINLKGCNLKMAKTRVQESLKPFLKEAIVSVKLANCLFSVLGEVKSPGPKNMHKDQITIFEAIGLAGDMTTYGKRKDVKLVRHYPNETKIYAIDLTDVNIIDSEFYYVYPNDLIYVRPMKIKMLGVGESFSWGILTTALAIYLTLYTIANN